MPLNPFVKYPRNTSQTDVERPGEGMEPIPEQVAGPNFPYRGYETHGVQPEGSWRDPAEYEGWNERGVIVDTEPVDDGPDPIPVRIVQGETKGRQLTRFAVSRSYATQPNPTQIVNAAFQTRQRLKTIVKNLDSNTVIIGASEAQANVMHGWPLAQNEVLTIDGEDDVWALATAGSGASSQLAVIVVYTQILPD